MARIRLNLRSLSVTEKIAKGGHIVTAITDIATFPHPSPSLTEVTATVDELATAFAAVQTARSEVTTRVVAQDNAETKLDQTLTKLAGYVESVAGNDEGIITRAVWRLRQIDVRLAWRPLPILRYLPLTPRAEQISSFLIL